MQHTDVFTGRLQIKQTESKEGNAKNTDVLHFLDSETAKRSPAPLCFQLDISLSSPLNMHDLVGCVLKCTKPCNKQPTLYRVSYQRGLFLDPQRDHFKVMTCKVVFILKALK